MAWFLSNFENSIRFRSKRRSLIFCQECSAGFCIVGFNLPKPLALRQAVRSSSASQSEICPHFNGRQATPKDPLCWLQVGLRIDPPPCSRNAHTVTLCTDELSSVWRGGQIDATDSSEADLNPLPLLTPTSVREHGG